MAAKRLLILLVVIAGELALAVTESKSMARSVLDGADEPISLELEGIDQSAWVPVVEIGGTMEIDPMSGDSPLRDGAFIAKVGILRNTTPGQYWGLSFLYSNTIVDSGNAFRKEPSGPQARAGTLLQFRNRRGHGLIRHWGVGTGAILDTRLKDDRAEVDSPSLIIELDLGLGSFLTVSILGESLSFSRIEPGENVGDTDVEVSDSATRVSASVRVGI